MSEITVRLALLVRLAKKENLDGEGLQAAMALWENPGRMDCRAQLEKQDLLVFPDLKASKEKMEKKETRE